MDQNLYTTRGNRPTVLWRPAPGGSVELDDDNYEPFTHLVRTVHLKEAVMNYIYSSMKPKPIYSLSTLKNNTLASDHPCKQLKVLWFGTRNDDDDPSQHDWYGNVQFAVPVQVVFERLKNIYLVEMMSAPTHSTTRILLTNKDYSDVLPRYDPRTTGGPWAITADGQHLAMTDCRRYDNKGYNKHGQILEFMIEDSCNGRRKITSQCEMTFRNHQNARNGDLPHVCHKLLRYSYPRPPCPDACTAYEAHQKFFEMKRYYYAQQRINKNAV